MLHAAARLLIAIFQGLCAAGRMWFDLNLGSCFTLVNNLLPRLLLASRSV